jgi:hypothetical protein
MSTTPYVDKYGQKINASWPGKTTSDDDLLQDAKDESAKLKDWSGPAGEYDQYGGWLKAGWHAVGTGYFTVLRHRGVWWLITPLGNPCFYTGLDTAPAQQWETTPVTGREGIFAELAPDEGEFADAWGGDAWGQDLGIKTYAFCASNLIRKYGSSWKDKFHDISLQRLKAWGFVGQGKWGDSYLGVPTTPDLNRTGVPTLAGHPDPFDPATRTSLFNVLSSQITPHIKDPNVVAWSVGNENVEIITPQEIQNILAGEAVVPAKKAMIDYILAQVYHGNLSDIERAWGVQSTATQPARDDLYAASSPQISDENIEVMRRFYADSYYALVEATVKSIDPNHLYAGFWMVPGGWENQSDWWLMARHCDIVGYDNYMPTFSDAGLSELFEQVDKPVMCGEFSFPQDDTDRGFGVFGFADAKSQEEAGRLYETYVAEAAKNPYCVGLNWFQYRDEPVTGRGPGHGSDLVYGENYAFGLVDITDKPKWTLLASVREANLKAANVRCKVK